MHAILNEISSIAIVQFYVSLHLLQAINAPS